MEHLWQQGDVIYVPQNVVHQHFAGTGKVTLLGAQNRLFKLMGYDSVIYRKTAPEWADADARHSARD